MTDEARRYLGKYGNKQAFFVPSTKLLPGRYVVLEGALRDVWRLVDDVNGTCMVTLKPQSQ